MRACHAAKLSRMIVEARISNTMVLASPPPNRRLPPPRQKALGLPSLRLMSRRSEQKKFGIRLVVNHKWTLVIQRSISNKERGCLTCKPRRDNHSNSCTNVVLTIPKLNNYVAISMILSWQQVVTSLAVPDKKKK